MSKKFDSFKHNRRSIRLQGWDYRSPAYYFVTILTHKRTPFFDNSSLRNLAEREWLAIENAPAFQHVKLDEWIVMPDHIHGILHFERWPASIEDAPQKADGFQNVQAGSLGAIIGRYKSTVSRKVNELNDSAGTTIWHRGYWERVLRNEAELHRTREYIRQNPLRSAEKEESLDKLLKRMTSH